jgi:hypothetical protein
MPQRSTGQGCKRDEDSPSHFARLPAPHHTEHLWDFIRSGDLPAWPYRGAELVEAIFAATGLDGVRSLLFTLRRDPKAAMLMFELLPRQPVPPS